VFGFARLRANGTLDPDFGDAGKIHFGSTSLSHLGIAMHPHLQGGRIVAAVGNYSAPDVNKTATGVVRLETDLILFDGFD